MGQFHTNVAIQSLLQPHQHILVCAVILNDAKKRSKGKTKNGKRIIRLLSNTWPQ
jgi:hypothetical protein